MFHYQWENIVLELDKEIPDIAAFQVNFEMVVDSLKSESGQTILYLKGFEGPCEKTKALIGYRPHLGDWQAHESIHQFGQELSQDTSQQDNDQQDTPQQEVHPHAWINLNWVKKVMQKKGLAEEGASFFEAVKSCLETGLSSKAQSVNLLGLGDVGLTLAIGLKLLGQGTLKRIGLFDINPKQRKRMMIELSQIIVNPEIEIVEIEASQLFEADAFIFCASKYVPPVGEKVDDVRMMQLASNASLIKHYAQMARQAQFGGLFCVVSDPVDLLCRAVLDYSNCNDQGQFDGLGLLPDQVIGFGLGVMHGRASYYGGQSYQKEGRVFGPHGKDLVVADSIVHYDHEASLKLTQEVITANLAVRDLGYKPYIAPAISSGAFSIINMLKGDWHYSAQFLGGQFWGNYHQRLPWVNYEVLVLDEGLMKRIENAYERLGQIWETFGA